MKFMDLLFKEYASPFILLDEVISSGQFNSFIDTFEEQREERQLWEYYIHKLPPWDERTYDVFKKEVKGGTVTKIERPSDEQLETTIKKSYAILQDFKITKEGGLNHGLVQGGW